MVRPIIRDLLFLAQKSEPASEVDKQVVQDLLDMLKVNQDRCVGMAANMIGVKKNIIVVAAGPFMFAMINAKITKRTLEKYLDKPIYDFDLMNKKDEVGIVRGLAWTSVGGDTLQIEVNVMPGKGDIELTGKLGDVMKESAKTGISYIRSIAPKYHIDAEYFKEHDFHIHIPEGAVPKDGPSAGITMATAVLSAITETPVNCKVAMTGEITLRGRVLPIGGLKEKLLAAKTAGITTVLVPRENERDVEEISKEIKDGMEICYMDTMEDVLAKAFVAAPKSTKRQTRSKKA